VRQKIFDAIKEHGNLKKALEAGVWWNKKKNQRIRHVRTAISEQHLRALAGRGTGSRPWKQAYVKEGDNHTLVIYEKEGAAGKRGSREFHFVSFFDAAQYYKTSNQKKADKSPLFPPVSPKGFPPLYVLKKDSMVLLYEKHPP